MSPDSPAPPAPQGQPEGPHRAVLRILAQRLSHEADLPQGLGLALAELEARLGLAPSRVYALRRGDRLRLLASHGLDPQSLAELGEVELGQGFSGLAAQRRRHVVMPVDHLGDRERAALLRRAGIQAVCALPLFLQGELVGILNVGSRRRVGFTPEEQGFLDVLAGLLAAAVAAWVRGQRLEAQGGDLASLRQEMDLKVAQQVGEVREQMAGLTQANQRLRDTWRLVMQAERTAAVSRFTSVLAHELRNPLMAIGGFAARLASSLGPDDPRSNYVKVIVHEVHHLEQQLSYVLKLNRERDLDFSELEPGQALREAYERALAMAGKPSQEPQWALEPGLPTTVTDRDLLTRALANLIQNALEATRGKGRVYLGASQDFDGRLLFSVGDDGPGIEPRERAHIFDPLYTTKEYGVGLGLPMCRDVVLLLGGELEVGERPGGGALFTVHLPTQPPESRPLRASLAEKAHEMV